MRFAISIPQFYADGEFDPAAFRSYLRRAEELGFHSGWTQEQILGTMPVLGPIETMTYAAACTERLRLGCAVFVTPLHNPVHLAKSIATLDQLSRGRVEVGIGAGGRGRPFGAFGHDGEGLVARFTEGLTVMRELWTRPEVTLDGRFWQLAGASIEPRPFQKPGPPVWFGGSHPNALRRAVRLGDGFFGAGSTTTEKFAEQVRVVRAEGRADFPIAKRIYIAVDDDGDRARKQIADGLAAIYRKRGLENVAVAGTPAECVRGVQEVVDAGAELILFTTVADQAKQMERLAAEVMPQVS
ncbi:LLM class flavin-dependent oxidoreductase [Amycolatopsis acidiphila]|uniref:LLM class flavin-dependent oxidoreductase n=1 Tax=Amycolatopsis acidiphila TaxID=715473 RepID=A0A557ZW17_9PSEU|nr:LLM class flavin-dependent oxidoreductase [Amycolatopsis acidiphila]TVT16170.1 LLM class flavin-dependent oxidoreductase [Amycolatopsis acidiphila]UIJ58061.1 LLM class flavin-dependent oxidoreductase [Amycolatopsis acidiphila]GHG70334.1 luciferase [Amycolatopsis acidiphila]